MKILFENYNTVTSTESSYLHNSFAQAGVEALIWESQTQNVSVFDLFDEVRPDFFVTHYMSLKPEVLRRLANDKCQLVLNVSGISENEAKNLEETLEEGNVKVKLLFYSVVKPSGFKGKTVQIMPAADIFLGVNPPSQNQIPWANVSENPIEEIPEEMQVYHNISMGNDYLGDTRLNVMQLIQRLNIYRNVQFYGSSEFVLGQPFLDATIRVTGKTTIKMNPENQQEVTKFMMDVFPDFPEDLEKSKAYMVSTILRKHTCLNRAERLAKHLGLEEAVKNLRDLQNSLNQQPTQAKVEQNS